MISAQEMMEEDYQPESSTEAQLYMSGQRTDVVPSSETPTQSADSPPVQDMDVSTEQTGHPPTLMDSENKVAPGVVPTSSDEEEDIVNNQPNGLDGSTTPKADEMKLATSPPSDIVPTTSDE